jgi:2-hydroxychromene-2-carboxylate isomerase
MSAEGAGMAELEFFFDLSSPWTFLGFINVQKLVARTGASIRYRPILVGGVFNAVNPAVYASRDNADTPRMRHAGRVLHEWAAWTGVTLRFPSPYHPAKSIHAMRMACALEDEQGSLVRFARAAFESYFLRAENLDDPQVLIAAANSAGLDGAALRTASLTDANKARLRTSTDELIARGGFGSPTMFVGRERMFFGNDQLPLVEFALTGRRPD